MAPDTARFAGQVALVTGGARGQGRSHALRFAREGADVVVCDVPRTAQTAPYDLGNEADLAETARGVESLGRRCLALRADVRDSQAIDGLVEAAGRIIATSSMSGKRGNPSLAQNSASKWGVIGLVKSLALELKDAGVTVNAVCTTNVDTPMVQNAFVYKRFRPDLENPTAEDAVAGFAAVNQIPVPWVAPEDVSDVVAFLASAEARYITGSTLDVSCGWTALMP